MKRVSPPVHGLLTHWTILSPKLEKESKENEEEDTVFPQTQKLCAHMNLYPIPHVCAVLKKLLRTRGFPRSLSQDHMAPT